MIDSFVDEGSIWMVLELCEGGELLDMIKKHTKDKQPIPEETIKTILLQTVDALGYLHDLRIIHRDIKPEKILKRGTDYVLAGFNIATKLDEGDNGSTLDQVGTPYYMAPEVMFK